MPRAPLPHLCALLAGAAAAVAVGCGDRSHLLPANDAQALKAQLASVQQAVDAGNCAEAIAAVDRASTVAQDLDPQQVDRRLRRRILDGIQRLRTTVPRDCEAAQTQTVETTPTETTTTETVPPETTTTTETVPPETTPTTPTTPTQTTPTETTPSTPTTPQTTPGGTQPDTGGTPDAGAAG